MAKDDAAAPTPAKKPRAKKAAAKPEGASAGKEKAAVAKAKPPAAKAPATPKERVIFPKDVYDERKDEIKAPMKERGLKWQFIGEGKGRYHGEGVTVFVMFTDEGVDYSIWGTDQAAVSACLAAWRAILGARGFAAAEARAEVVAQAEEEARESEALRMWRLQEPQRRPGEPDFFFKKRTEEWRAKKPA